MTQPKVYCKHIKENGERCKNNAMPGRRFCYLASHCGAAPLETRVKNFFQNNWKLSGFVLLFTLLVGIPALYSYSPRISVAPAGSVRPHEPLGTIFNVTNNGPVFDLHNVTHACNLISVKGGPIGNFAVRGYATPSATLLGDLPAGATKSLSCERIVQGFTGDASISIDIIYDYPLWPRRAGKAFLFEAEKADDGTWVWKAK